MVSKFLKPISTYLRLFVGLLLAGVAIVYLQQNVDAQAVWQALGVANWGWVAGAVGCMLLTAMGLARRWQILMKDGVDGAKLEVGFFYVLQVLLVGLMLNTLFPLRAGDVTRAYIMGREGGGHSFTVGTMVLEKVFDLIMLVMMFFLLLLQVSLPAWVNSQGYSVVLGASIILLAILLLFFSRQLSWVSSQKIGVNMQKTCRVSETRQVSPLIIEHIIPDEVKEQSFFSQNLSRWLGILSNGLSSLDILQQRQVLLRLGIYSLLISVISFLTNVFVIWALQLDVPLVAGLLVLVVLQLGLPFASVPGKIGVFEYLCVLSLSVFGVDEASALSFGILLHVVVLVPSLLGLLSFITLKRN